MRKSFLIFFQSFKPKPTCVWSTSYAAVRDFYIGQHINNYTCIISIHVNVPNTASYLELNWSHNLYQLKKSKELYCLNWLNRVPSIMHLLYFRCMHWGVIIHTPKLPHKSVWVQILENYCYDGNNALFLVFTTCTVLFQSWLKLVGSKPELQHDNYMWSLGKIAPLLHQIPYFLV